MTVHAGLLPRDFAEAKKRIAARRASLDARPSSLALLDAHALRRAHDRVRMQPRADYSINQLPVLANPLPTALVPLWYNGQTYQAPLGVLNGIAPSFPVFNVKAFGALGNGSADDTLAIQAAINAASTAGGGIVFFPIGTYLVSAYLNVASNVEFLGAGWGSIIKQFGSTFAAWGLFQGTGVSNVNFTDLQFEGNGITNNAFNANYLTQFTSSSFIKYFRCRFSNTQQTSIGSHLTSDVTVDSCDFDTSGAGATVPTFMPAINCDFAPSTSNRWTIVNCTFNNLLWTAIWLQANDSLVQGCIFTSVGEAGVNNNGLRNRFIGNVARDGYAVSQDAPWLESFSDDAVIANNIVYNQGQSGAHFGVPANAGAGIFVGSGSAIVTGNLVYNCLGYGIEINTNNVDSFGGSGQNLVVANNTVVGCGDPTEPPSQTGGIIFTGATPALNNVSISGNTCSGNFPSVNGGGNDLINPTASYTNANFVSKGNSPWVDSIAAANLQLTGSTAQTVLEQLLLGACSMGTSGGFRANAKGTFALASATASLQVVHGGGAYIQLGGTFLAGDTITYTLNAHAVIYTVIAGSTSILQVAQGLAAAINADGTDGPLVTAVGNGNVVSDMGYVSLSAKAAALAAGTLAHSLAKSSTAGTATMSGGHLTKSLATYVSASSSDTAAYSIEIEAINQGRNTQIYNVTVLEGATVKSQTTVTADLDSSVAQSLVVYGTLGNAGDAINNSFLSYVRV